MAISVTRADSQVNPYHRPTAKRLAALEWLFGPATVPDDVWNEWTDGIFDHWQTLVGPWKPGPFTKYRSGLPELETAYGNGVCLLLTHGGLRIFSSTLVVTIPLPDIAGIKIQSRSDPSSWYDSNAELWGHRIDTVGDVLVVRVRDRQGLRDVELQLEEEAEAHAWRDYLGRVSAF